MCGINFIISTKHHRIEEPLGRMQKVSTFRGSDDNNTFYVHQERFTLGMGVNRLQVIDADENSNQPLKSKCGNYVLAYNGEVYNYQDLKNKLISKGYQFFTRSDTEVILYWLQEFGKDGLSDFKGMFALVFLDLKNSEFFCARDIHGIKPLYYYKTDELLIISSTIPSIEESGLTSLSLNSWAIEDYLAYRHVLGPRTFYNEVRAVTPSEIISFGTNNTIEISKISHQDTKTDRSLKDILIDSLSLVYEANKAPGILLSGGVDSTLLLAILNKELGICGVPTFTLGSGEDKEWAERASNQFGSAHQEVPVDINALNRLDEYLVKTDQPIADHGAFATWLVAEQAALTTNVLLSGAGADELFGGYNRHWAYAFYLRRNKLSVFISNLIRNTKLDRVLPVTVRQFSKGVNNDPIETYCSFLQNYAIKKMNNSEVLWAEPKKMADNLSLALEFDRKNYLVNDVLAITDNSTMQHGVEARVPYLHDDVVTYSMNLSLSEKMKLKGKGPLKKLLKEYGGSEYANRKKQGFGLPMKEWLRDEKSFGLWNFLEKDSPIYPFVEKAQIIELVKQHQEGRKDNNMQLWSILVLEKWLAKHS